MTIEILRNRNLTTRFQILVEIADSGPNIQQRDIAKKLDISPQAVSDYISQLTQDGMLASEGRSKYKVTNEGVNWILKALRDLRSYNAFIEKAVTSMSTCTAIAECTLSKGQAVGLEMKDGLLLASDWEGKGAKGISVSDAKEGEDVGVTDIEGIVSLHIGRVTILRVPSVQKGGSKKVNSVQLKKQVKGRPFIAGIGLEAIVALKKVDAKFYMYGATEAALEAANSGLNPLVVCVEEEASTLIGRLEEGEISYELFDIETN